MKRIITTLTLFTGILLTTLASANTYKMPMATITKLQSNSVLWGSATGCLLRYQYLPHYTEHYMWGNDITGLQNKLEKEFISNLNRKVEMVMSLGLSMGVLGEGSMFPTEQDYKDWFVNAVLINEIRENQAWVHALECQNILADLNLTVGDGLNQKPKTSTELFKFEMELKKKEEEIKRISLLLERKQDQINDRQKQLDEEEQRLDKKEQELNNVYGCNDKSSDVSYENIGGFIMPLGGDTSLVTLKLYNTGYDAGTNLDISPVCSNVETYNMDVVESNIQTQLTEDGLVKFKVDYDAVGSLNCNVTIHGVAE